MQKILYFIGTEIFKFGQLEPEIIGFEDGRGLQSLSYQEICQFVFKPNSFCHFCFDHNVSVPIGKLMMKGFQNTHDF